MLLRRTSEPPSPVAARLSRSTATARTASPGSLCVVRRGDRERDPTVRRVRHADGRDVGRRVLVVAGIRERRLRRAGVRRPASIRRVVRRDELGPCERLAPRAHGQHAEDRVAPEVRLRHAQREHTACEPAADPRRAARNHLGAVEVVELDLARGHVADERLVAEVARVRVRVEVEPDVDPAVRRQRLVVPHVDRDRDDAVGRLGHLHRGDVGGVVVVARRVRVRRRRQRKTGADEEARGSGASDGQLQRTPSPMGCVANRAHTLKERAPCVNQMATLLRESRPCQGPSSRPRSSSVSRSASRRGAARP